MGGREPERCWEIGRTGGGGPVVLPGLKVPLKVGAALGAWRGAAPGRGCRNPVEERAPLGSRAQSLINSHACLPCGLAALLLGIDST